MKPFSFDMHREKTYLSEYTVCLNKQSTKNNENMKFRMKIRVGMPSEFDCTGVGQGSFHCIKFFHFVAYLITCTTQTYL